MVPDEEETPIPLKMDVVLTAEIESSGKSTLFPNEALPKIRLSVTVISQLFVYINSTIATIINIIAIINAGILKSAHVPLLNITKAKSMIAIKTIAISNTLLLVGFPIINVFSSFYCYLSNLPEFKCFYIAV